MSIHTEHARSKEYISAHLALFMLMPGKRRCCMKFKLILEQVLGWYADGGGCQSERVSSIAEDPRVAAQLLHKDSMNIQGAYCCSAFYLQNSTFSKWS